jgi:hypothetical protein
MRKGQKGGALIKKTEKKDPTTQTTETSFRPNKFGVNAASTANAMNSNKTQDSFQQQKSTCNASTANQTTQSTTVYSNRTASSQKRMQAGTSPFTKARRHRFGGNAG